MRNQVKMCKDSLAVGIPEHPSLTVFLQCSIKLMERSRRISFFLLFKALLERVLPFLDTV